MFIVTSIFNSSAVKLNSQIFIARIDFVVELILFLLFNFKKISKKSIYDAVLHTKILCGVGIAG